MPAVPANSCSRNTAAMQNTGCGLPMAAVMVCAAATVATIADAAEGVRCGVGKEDPPEASVIATIPRYNMNFEKISSAMNEYEWLKWDQTCNDEPLICFRNGRFEPNRTACASGCYVTNVEIYPPSGTTMDDSSGGSYLQGVVVWGAIWIIILVLGLVLGIGCSIWSCWSCTCRHVCCCKTKEGDTRKFCCCVKSPRRRCQCAYFCVHIMVIAPLLVLLIFIVLGNAKGNATFVESVNLVLESPEGFSKITDIGFDAADSAITMAKESVDEVIRVNETIGATASFVEIGTYLTCIETMLMSLPDTSVVKNELDNVAIGMNLLPSTAEFDAMIGAEMETPMERTEELLVSFQNSVSSIALPLTTMIADGDISAVATELGNVLDAMTLVKSECTDLQSGISTIQGLQPSDAQFDSTIADLDDLAANFASHAGTGNTAARAALTNRLDTMQTALSSFSNGLTAFQSDLTAFTDSIAAADMQTLNARIGQIDSVMASIPDLTTPTGISSSIGPTLSTFNSSGLEAVLYAVDNVTNAHLPNTSLITAELDKIDAIIGGIRCVDRLVAVAQAINSSLVRVPPESTAIMDALSGTESIAEGVLNMTDDLQHQLAVFDNTTTVLTSINTSSIISTLQVITNGVSSLDFSSLGSDPAFASLENLVTGWPNQPWRAQLNSFEDQVQGPSFDLTAYCCESDSHVQVIRSSVSATVDMIVAFKTWISAWESSGAPTSEESTGASQASALSTALRGTQAAMAGLSSLGTLHSNLDTITGESLPDKTATMAEVNGIESSLQSGLDNLDSVLISVGGAQNQIDSSKSAISAVKVQFAQITVITDAIAPVLEVATNGVDILGMALDVLPPDSISLISTFKSMIDQLITLQSSFNANISSIQTMVDDGREQILSARENFVLYKLFHGNDNFTLPPPGELGDMTVASVLNLSENCSSIGCFQNLVRYIDDNFVDLVIHIGQAQLDADVNISLGMSRTELFLVLYILVAFGAVLAIVGTCILTETDSEVKDRRCSRCLHCTGLVLRGTGSWILTWMAALYLLVAALLMPSAIFLSDSCGSIELVLSQFLGDDQALGLNYPHFTLKDETELADYLDMVPLGNFSSDFSYPLQPIVVQGPAPFVRQYFQSCNGIDNQMNGTLVGAVNFTGRLLENATLEVVDYGVRQIQNLSGEIQPGLMQHINAFKEIAAVGVPATFGSMQKMVECERINAAYFQVKEAFCCEFVIMLYWMAISSAVIGCCGCWSTVTLGCTADLRKERGDSGTDLLYSNSDHAKSSKPVEVSTSEDEFVLDFGGRP